MRTLCEDTDLIQVGETHWWVTGKRGSACLVFINSEARSGSTQTKGCPDGTVAQLAVPHGGMETNATRRFVFVYYQRMMEVIVHDSTELEVLVSTPRAICVSPVAKGVTCAWNRIFSPPKLYSSSPSRSVNLLRALRTRNVQCRRTSSCKRTRSATSCRASPTLASSPAQTPHRFAGDGMHHTFPCDKV